MAGYHVEGLYRDNRVSRERGFQQRASSGLLVGGDWSRIRLENVLPGWDSGDGD